MLKSQREERGSDGEKGSKRREHVQFNKDFILEPCGDIEHDI